ncbi:hypothetical protein VCRA2119O147_400009 [Vibrio crassostreae]|nr:hypothetical protein VCRA2113O207_110029 [Vibrio crassostreae]CAK1713873.1 hypothetical protein VCRA2112O184_110030 [Vibrio crassostreae]CAK1723604.1 hypothetical protein VCRA2113O227_110125 [Vibrio crassostreae]CAK1725030.1 hypothetical protein VCRA2118O144_110125 [Vibrio crassostreae]CAK1725259.1 hypothetical protein VCRA2113O231_110127 [Vibrio crassostreae]
MLESYSYLFSLNNGVCTIIISIQCANRKTVQFRLLLKIGHTHN